MAIVFDSDAGTITGLSVGGLPDGIVDAGTLATDSVTAAKIAANSVDSAELIDGAVDDSHMASISGRKNIVMNGAFQVWQRGTSFTANSDTFGADRWAIQRENQTVTKEIASIGDIRCNSMKMLKTGSGAITAYHSIEDGTGVSAGGSLFNGKTLTLSYYARASGSFDNNGQIWLYYNNNSSSVQVATCTDSLTTSWTKFTHTFTMPTNTQTYANVYSLTLSLIRALDGNVGNSDWVELAQVQLELGSTATDFEHRSYGEELALCQRYYETSMTFGDLSQYQGQQPVAGMAHATYGAAVSSAGGRQFRTWKRATPTVTIYHQDGTSGAVYLIHTGAKITGVTASHINQNGFLFVTKSSGFNSGYYYYYGITVDAEL